MRDDFSEAVRRTVAGRVNYRCSNPWCRARTSGPHDEPSRSLNIGVAAHITAASPGGPRYDPSISQAQRKGPENAILLCQVCAKLIDNDESRFNVSMLRQWKKDAEAEALALIGKVAGEYSEEELTLLISGFDSVEIIRILASSFSSALLA